MNSTEAIEKQATESWVWVWNSLFSSLSSRWTVAILLKDDYFVSGAGLPGRFKAEKVEFHWGHSNGSAGSEHSVNGRRFPVEVRKPGPQGFPVWVTVIFGGAVQVRRTFPAFLSQETLCVAHGRGPPVRLISAQQESTKRPRADWP